MLTEIKDLYIYPIKSLKGLSVQSLAFTEQGVVNDRRYLLIDQQNRMITQRSHAILSQFSLVEVAHGWQVVAPNGDAMEIDDDEILQDKISTSVWKNELACFEKSKTVSQWFSDQLNAPIRLVALDTSQPRSKKVADLAAPLAFADAYPLLVANQNSLNSLNEKLNQALAMERFRPNVVVSMAAEQEFDLAGLNNEHGKIIFAEPCVRCNVPAINPVTSEYSKALHEKLKQELLRDEKVVFGVNAAVDGLATIELGQKFHAF